MNFSDYIEINPTILLTKGKQYPFVEMAKLYNQPTTTFTPLETVQTGACTYKIFVYKSADISYNESAML